MCVDNLVLPAFFGIDDCSDENITTTVSGVIGNQTLTDATPGVIAGVNVGVHTLFYRAEDGCGNQTIHTVIIKVEDTSGPAMFCVDRIAVNLGNSFNTSDLGGAIDIWANDFGCKVEDCSSTADNPSTCMMVAYPAATGAHGSTPPAHADPLSVRFTCGDLGTQLVDVWSCDNSNNWSVVTVMVDVQDNLGFCTNAGTTGGTANGNTTGGAGNGNTTGGGGDGGVPCSVAFTATGGSDQIAVAIASNSAPYTISWDGPVSSHYVLPSGSNYTIPSLPAGSYSITVIDHSGCSSTQNNIIVSGNVVVQPCAVSFTATGGSGEIAVLINSGPLPYTISWDGPVSNFHRVQSGNNYTIPSLSAGSYVITVTDANGCFSTQRNITVSVANNGGGGGVVTPCPVSFTATGGSGQIAVSIASGPLPYTISWDGPVSNFHRVLSGNNFTIPSLPAGSYVITVTDADGCFSTQRNIIVSSANNGGGGNNGCTVNYTTVAGNGQISVDIASGSLPYTISWDGPVSNFDRITSGNTYVISGLTAGVYTVTVTDANGCFSTHFSIVVMVSNTGGGSCPLDFTAQAGNGSITVTANSGPAPYTISWDGPVRDFFRIFDENTYTIPSLPVGLYVITVTDANGCFSTQMVMVAQSGNTGGDGNTGGGVSGPCPVSFITDVGAGVIWVDVLGDSGPFTIGWDGPVSGFFQPTGRGYNITNLPAGVYTVIVTDANGCFSREVVMVTSPNTGGAGCTVAFTATAGAGSIAVTTRSGPTPYTIGWDGPVTGFFRVNTPNYTIADLPIGVYTVIVTDANGCFSSEIVSVNQAGNTGGGSCPVDFTITAGAGLIDVVVNSGPQPYTIGWDGPVTGNFRVNTGNTYTIEDLPVGNYTVIVTDANGCFSTDNIVVNVPADAGDTGGGDTGGGDDGAGEGDMAAIAGFITNEEGEFVENVTINLSGYNSSPLVTGATGSYRFNSIPMFSNYTVTPEKNVDPLNGVSTFDLVLISKHILGIAELDSPYKHIAADINHSGTITAFDMVQLRQLILNITTDFENNHSWRFVDADYKFSTATPENESFPEITSINYLSKDMMDAHFVAVKIGDVSGNALVNTLTGSEPRSMTEAATISMEDKIFEKGDLIEVNFNLNDMEQILGYQFTVNVDPASANLVELREGLATEANFGLMHADRGLLTASWNNPAGVATSEDGALFTLILKATKAGRLSEIIELNSDLTAKEAYNEAGELMDVVLDFGTATETFSLHQNKPNPFRDVTNIGFDLPTATTVQLSIFDVSGQLVKSIKGEFSKGYNEVQIEKSDLSGNGIYFYNLETNNNVAKRRMILID